MSPRDGLQALNPQRVVPIELRVGLIRSLAEAGLSYIEIGAWVSARAVPQMACSSEVAAAVADVAGVERAGLVPTVKYYDAFKASGCQTLALMVSASETYSQSNMRMSCAETLASAQALAERARGDGIGLRAHLSAAFGEPRADLPDNLDQVVSLAGALDRLGCSVIALADTFGTAHPRRVRDVVARIAREIDLARIGVHLHDTLGLGIANALAAFEAGVNTFDASVGGIGGSPFYPGSSGNIATEELAELLEGLGATTGVNRAQLVEAGRMVQEITRFSGDPDPPSKLLRHHLARRA